MDQPAPSVVISVPGMWENREEIIAAVVSESNGLLMIGPLLRELETGDTYMVRIAEHDPALARAFAIAGRRSMSPEEIAAIERHTFTLFVIGDGASPERARAMMRVIAGLLRAGGLGVKVETAGVAHNISGWNELTEAPEPAALYHAFVTMVSAEEVYYSCGMHNLGLPDVNVPRGMPADEAANLMQRFLLYILYENPDLSSGDTFSLAPDAPYFRLERVPCAMFPPDDSFHNPYGIWMLSPLEES
jgi:hypothetical protein